MFFLGEFLGEFLGDLLEGSSKSDQRVDWLIRCQANVVIMFRQKDPCFCSISIPHSLGKVPYFIYDDKRLSISGIVPSKREWRHLTSSNVSFSAKLRD